MTANVIPPPESPALVHGAAAYELKFVLPESLAQQVEARLAAALVPDPHADPARGGYRVSSVYFDTPGFDVFHRGDGHREDKFRVRRYGNGSALFLEQKTKQKGCVSKRRTTVRPDDLARLADADADWSGAWFAREVRDRNLRPVCRVTYDRSAFVGTSSDGPVRATIDRHPRGREATGPRPDGTDGVPLLAGEAVVEFKYVSALPVVFKRIIEELRLDPRGGSKYRRCATAVGLVPPPAATSSPPAA